jgi:SAM-dependent methyltransferase
MTTWFFAITAYFRRRRMLRFASVLAITPQTRVLDVGGTLDYWRLLPDPPQVTLLNTLMARDTLRSASGWVAGDGRCLPFRDNAFDVVFSNSVIEHVGDSESQARFARESARVGRRFWVQTPNRWFPLEQHLFLPLLHWLPRQWQRVVVPRFHLVHRVLRLTPDQREFYVRHYLQDIRLLDAAALRALFPGARLIRERFCGWTKSLIVYREQE